MVRCSYCKKSSSSERTNHSFPLNNPGLLEQWLKNMRVENWMPTVHSRMCSDHFLNDCYVIKEGSSRRTLRKGSVPTVFTGGRKECAYCKIPKTQGQLKRPFHKFPLSAPKTLEKWLCNMALEEWYPTAESILCSDHFEPSCFSLVRGYLTLRDGSVPSIFSTGSRMEDTASTGQTPTEESPVTEITEVPESNLVLDGNDEDAEIVIDSSESLVECPKCHHTFEPGFLDRNSKRKSPSAENCSKRLCTESHMKQCELSECVIEMGFNTLDKPSEPAATSSSTSQQQREFKSPTVTEKKRLVVHDHHYESSPHTARSKLQSFRERNKKLCHGLRFERQRCNRLTKRITSLREVVGELRRNRTLPENSLACLDAIADTDVSEFLKRFLKNAQSKSTEQSGSPTKKKRPWKSQRNKCKAEGKGPTREKYPPSLRAFALTLHFYSPKAYAFVRAKFCKALPESSTLRAWYSAVDGEPGFTSQSFEALKAKVADNKHKNKRTLCSVMLDEVGIKKGINRAPNGKVRGYIDLGTDIELSDSLGLAKDALVIMAVAADSNWKLPIGYFLRGYPHL